MNDDHFYYTRKNHELKNKWVKYGFGDIPRMYLHRASWK